MELHKTNGVAEPEAFKPDQSSNDKVIELSKQSVENGNGNHMKRHKQREEKQNKAREIYRILMDNFYLFDDGRFHLISKKNIEKYSVFDTNQISYYTDAIHQFTAVKRAVLKDADDFIEDVDDVIGIELKRFKETSRQFNEVGFDPTGKRNIINTFPKQFNTVYVGDKEKPEEFHFPKTKHFLLEVLCSGDEELYGYLMKYIAHALQKPEEKPKVMLIFKSIEEGTGKGTFGELLQLIFGKIAYPVKNPKSIFKYGDILMRTYWLIFDEFNSLIDPESQDHLKHLITEPIISGRKIYGAEVPIHSVHRLIATTNTDKMTKTSKTSRRFVFFNVNPIQRDATEYFTELRQAWEDGELNELVGYLTALDIGDFVPYSDKCRPKNAELDEQKTKTFEGLDKLLFHMADTGKIPRFTIDDKGKENVDEVFYPIDGTHLAGKLIQKILTSHLTKQYHVYDNDKHWDFKTIRHFLETAGIKYRRTTVNRDTVRGYDFPDFLTFRDLVRKYLGLSDKYEWTISYEELLEEIQDGFCQKVTPK